MTGPRAVGVRRTYLDIPEPVRDWVSAELGSPVTGTDEQVGGMSPGCATRVVTASGHRAFVKAVGPELNPQTPELFRHEIRVLRHLGGDTCWAALLAGYDEPRGWVAVLLEDVAGRHPDVDAASDRAAVLTATDRLVDRLAGRGRGLHIDTVPRALARIEAMWPLLPDLPPDLLPSWAQEAAAEVRRTMPALLEAAEGDHLVHHDIRGDNLLLRDDGSVVFLDWGMARVGAPWLDPLLVRLAWVDDPLFDELVHASPVLADLGDELVTTFLFVFGAWLAHRSSVAEDTNLPTLGEFRLRESARILAGARRRLGR